MGNSERGIYRCSTRGNSDAPKEMPFCNAMGAKGTVVVNDRLALSSTRYFNENYTIFENVVLRFTIFGLACSAMHVANFVQSTFRKTMFSILLTISLV